MDAPKKTPAAPQLPQAMQLNEDAQLRVLSGRTTYVAEAKKKEEAEVKEATKTDKPWKDSSGKEHPGTAVKGDKYKGDEAEKEEKSKKTDESKMMPKGKKRPVKESVESTLSFREMMNLVVESGGQQQIDAVDQELFAWAKRVAKQKIGEGMKAEVYAGLVYERMGGKFEMFDVLSEDQK